MIRPKPLASSSGGLLPRRWVALGYATFALALLLLAAIQVANVVGQLWVALFLVVLVVAAPITGLFLGRGRRQQHRPLALALLAVEGIAALGLVAVTGGATSPMWVALLLVSTATPLLLRGRWAAALLILVWLADGLFLLQVPAPALVPLALTWALRAAGVGLVGVVLYRTLSIEEGVRVRSQRREQVLHEFLKVSNRLRVTSQPQQVLEEVAQAVQSSGNFDCVTLSQVDWHAGTVTVTLAIGASGRRLSAVEGLRMPWNDFAPLLNPARRAGQSTYRADLLPFRSIRGEHHLVLPLSSQFAEVQGLMTVSAAAKQHEALEEALPLLELLANQAATALDNNILYSTMEQRVIAATATIEQGRAELALARDRAETLYRIVRTLAVSLDEREVLSQALELIAQATDARHGGMMLVEPTSGRLVFRTIYQAKRGVLTGSAAAPDELERAHALAGWVLANRQVAVLEDTRHDTRWPLHSIAGEHERSALAAPLMLEDELLGVLVLVHHQPGHFNAEHGQLALAAAGQIAVALSKAQLYRYVSEQSERLGITVRQREEEISKTFAILRSIADGVVVGDRRGRVRMINPAAEVILGIQANAFLGRQMSDLPGVPTDPLQTQLEGVQQLQVGEHALHAHFAPVRAADGEGLGSVVVYHDITREVMADRLKSEFIATASHELRTPLTSIRGYVDLLLLGTLGPVSDAQGNFLKVVKNNVARLVDLIDDLLDVSKAEAGEIRLRREVTDLSEILYEVSEALYSQFTERSISLAIDVQPGLPRIMADRQRLRQIAVNLVSNACKYTPVGGHVDITLRNGNNRLRVDVRDNGVGIQAEAQRFIFTPFFRADNPLRDEVGGTGLGLSITKRLVELHGGEIWFDTSEGQGTTFSFALPLNAQEWTPVEWLERAEAPTT